MTHLKPYYIDLNRSVGEDFSEYEFDDQGVPMVRFNRSKTWKNNPVTVCQYALNHFNNYLINKDENSRLKFILQAQWLLDHCETGPEDTAVWYYRLNIPFYGLTSPWISGMAQGEAISVLLRAHRMTNNPTFLNIAERAWKIFQIHSSVVTAYPDGGKVIEEYPTESSSCVLNGFIFALFGIYDYYAFTGDEKAGKLFDECVQSLKTNIIRYDTGSWSLYDLYPPLRLTSRSYHRLHLMLLSALYKLTNEDIFDETRIRWEKYMTNPICNLKWTLTKIKQRIWL